MDTLQIAIILLIALFTLLSLGFWVATTLFSVAILALILNQQSAIDMILATTIWSGSSSWTISALPLFIWMGEILFRTRLSEDLFKGLSPWLAKLPGGLLHVNIIGCGIFAAVSGSSAATTATIGKMSLPELRARGYAESMAMGTLAGSGTLGFLIPPSIILIVYGVSAEVSISRLFMAGALPGLMLIGLFMSYVVIWSLLNPSKLPRENTSMTLVEKLRHTRQLFPILSLIAFVIGSIYLGWATATEAATLGVVGSLALAWCTGSLSWDMFKTSLIGAACMSAMILLILAGANLLTVAMGFLRLPAMLAEWVVNLHLSAGWLLIALTVLFAILGCFLDGISVVVLTTSVILPLVEASGINLLWFGIYLVLVVEMSQITPPVGFNLFVIQSLSGRDIFKIAGYALPFFSILVLAILLLTCFPDIVLWLPGLLTQHAH
ncbi:TRAP transporter large permease [Gynuella sp.]|uniref:TRAP transporter large permease n=1 Tax=Gynuella sp. TaxID=2969146 RepID=UPI003D150834